MMKILGLVLALGILVTGACVADSVTMNIQTGFNMIAVPIVPFDSTPAAVFANVFAQYPNNQPFGALSTLDFGSGKAYDPINPGGFGGVMLGQGYWLKPKTAAASVTFTGFPDGLADTTGGAQTDMWISLPGASDGVNGAWHMFGQPFDHNTYPADIRFTDGTDVKTWAEAVALNWVYNTATGCDIALKGGNFTVSYDSLFSRDTCFRARHGYQIRTKKANLAMIIPALPVAP